ncbi:MAG: adenosylcobalamin-dependent ribonucleoside-diphosphate reductase [Inhella sp.]|uniref:adenosylcobalamin-dependent ribonucleoside-diphosphate reductase n=1 Tax=Inhella sp. TaxID=1921806 RepID=UPI0022C5DD6D|nr:adenosylcobalamin-dependent ribonucleoside-diphosphate reductase [Inhella sp.]MCZ8234313.1 adenosylcobalamin-dependent ribonucleoside-diphosphate reductase [Inhella sp.]
MNDVSQPISSDVLLDTYAQPGETTVDEVRHRIAQALAQAEAPAQRALRAAQFLAVQREGFIVAGRVAAHAGTGAKSTMINCFVQPLCDSITHAEGGIPGIYTALMETAETLRLGGGVGIDFSPIRPRGARIAGVDTLGLGPVGFLQLFNLSCELLGSTARRPGAQMGVLRCDHPDALAFAQVKTQGGLASFNLSVAVTDAFMQAVNDDTEFELVHAAEPGPVQQAAGATRRADGLWVYQRLPARRLWAAIVGGAHERGEPGVLFVDRIQADNNLGYCERIAATNPCGEQPLPPYGACCLGSINLVQLVERPFEPSARLALERLDTMVPVAVRMLDNVLQLTHWPLPQQRQQALAKRRIGLGFTGLGDALIMLGLPYDSEAARQLAAGVARTLRDRAYEASIALAHERGPFPSFKADGVLRRGSFASRLPGALQRDIRAHGLRNSHLLSIAPAGSVSLAFADNVSSGIEPPYAWHYLRHRRRRDGLGLAAYDVVDPAWRLHRALRGASAPLGPAFATATQLPPAAHLSMVAAVAPYIDGAISKTVNANEGCAYDDFEALFRQAWKDGLKGVTAFRSRGVLGSVLQAPAPRHGTHTGSPA